VKEAQLEASSPVSEVIKHGRKPLSRVFMINVGSHAHSYIYQVFIGAYLISTVKVPPTIVPQMLLLGGMAAIPAAFLAGRASDKWGRKPVNLFILAFLFLFSFPAFWLVNTGSVWLIATVYVLGFAFAVEGAIAAQSAMFAELFGSRYRYAGVALAREFSAIFGGGIAPMICSALLAWATGAFWPIAGYMMIVISISIVQSLRTPETVDRDLASPQDAN
jgi:MFS family permease